MKEIYKYTTILLLVGICLGTGNVSPSIANTLNKVELFNKD